MSSVFLLSAALGLPMGAERQTTMHDPYFALVEWQHSRQARGLDPLDFALPIWKQSYRSQPKFNWGDSTNVFRVGLIGGGETRRQSWAADQNDVVQAADLGLRVHAGLGMLQMSTDARIFVERHSRTDFLSWDGEVMDHSQEGDLSNFTFTSFARYRTDVQLQSDFGTWGFRRDAEHWGPGRFYNLVFHGASPAFGHFYWTGSWTQFRVLTLWGSLAIDGIGDYLRTHNTRSVYAHRYEWTPSANWLLGLSEQQILFNQESPSALLPLVPLFIEKGTNAERENNGNLALDLTWRQPRWGLMAYGEFLIDDMQEPSSLFGSFWGNRWGALAGIHKSTLSPWGQWETYAEWSRLEPWVYTHYVSGGAQPAHYGRPLGNPLGPNSMGLTVGSALRADFNWRLGLEAAWIWKGQDPGSSIADTNAHMGYLTKQFLANDPEPDWTITPVVSWKWWNTHWESRLDLRDGPWGGRLRMTLEY